MDQTSGPRDGLTLHLYDPAAQRWSLYGADSLRGILQPALTGTFEGRRGAFFAREIFEDREILSRFTWSDLTATSCRWQQAFSIDAGAGWETNWLMEFTRLS